MTAVSQSPAMVNAAQASSGLGLYIHVPFCSSTCDFCAFYQEKPERGDFDRYVDGIGRELELLGGPLPVDTIFWGGGTPGLLPPAQIRRLGKVLRNATVEPPVEWSIEMTPGCVKEERLEALAEIGVTRISLGAQSFQPKLLEALGRLHPREKIFSAYRLLRKHGFKNVNLDLMFALPGQTPEEWALDLSEAISLEPDHLSTYCLTFEEDTALYVQLSKGQVSRNEETEVAFYHTTWETLARAGFHQYEISNYARPGRECRHNLNTWDMREWIGLGPVAASQYGGRRSSNPANLDLWLERLEAGIRSDEQVQLLTDELVASDFLIFGLRLNAGVDLGMLRERFARHPPAVLQTYLDGLEEEGLAVRTGDRLRLTPSGRLVVDRIGMEVLEIFDSG